MQRVARSIVALGLLSIPCGCYGPGLLRSIGSIPGTGWTDYAFTFYCDTATQLYPASPAQIESSMYEALADLGYIDIQPPQHEDGVSLIRVRARDGRPVKIKIMPQNAMTMVSVAVGPCFLGDYQLSRDLLRRVALNFGTAMRAYTPVDTTLPRRFNPPNPVQPPVLPRPPEALKGEGLRPGLTREAIQNEEQTMPGSAVPTMLGIPGLGGFVPTMGYPNPPNMPYAPWPYTPFNENQ